MSDTEKEVMSVTEQPMETECPSPGSLEVKSPLNKKVKEDSPSPESPGEVKSPVQSPSGVKSPSEVKSPEAEVTSTPEGSPNPDQKKGGLTLADIPPWPEYEFSRPKQFEVNEAFNAKVSLFRGDITQLQIDAIVNAANSGLRPGGGVCGAIHDAAGRKLEAECKKLRGCPEGDAKITGGYNLFAKHVIHTVGPTSTDPPVLASCYQRCFEVLLENNLKSIAFPCIGTGIYGFPNDRASKIALFQTRKFLEKHHEEIDRIIFCVFLEKDLLLYENWMPNVFPLH